MPFDSERVKTRERLGAITEFIYDIFAKPWKDAGREGPSPLTMVTEIFGRDIRAGGGLDPLSDAEIAALIPKAEACLNTLEVLEKLGMFPPQKAWSSFDKVVPR